MKAFFKVVLSMLLALAMVAPAAAAEEKMVYHVSDIDNAMSALYNVRNHLRASPAAKIVVVANGSGIEFLIEGAKDKNGNPYDIMIEELAAKKVQFRVCNNSLVGHKIDKSKVVQEATIVPSGVAEIGRLQSQEGYGYLKP